MPPAPKRFSRLSTLTIGIDPSATATGLVSLDRHGEVVSARTVSPSMAGTRRLTYVHRTVSEWISDQCAFSPIVHICMEGYGYGTQMAHTLGEVGGVIKLALIETLGDRLVAYPTVPAPNQVKKWATGKGVGAKEDMMLAVYKRWNVELADNNQIDAYVLARMAGALESGETEIAAQVEVLESLRHPKKGKPSALHQSAPSDLWYPA